MRFYFYFFSWGLNSLDLDLTVQEVRSFLEESACKKAVGVLRVFFVRGGFPAN